MKKNKQLVKLIIFFTFISMCFYFFIIYADNIKMEKQQRYDILNIDRKNNTEDYLVFVSPIVYPGDNLEYLIDQYNEKYPDKMVKAIRIPKESYYETLNLMLTSGEQVDIFQMDAEWFPSYVKNDFLLMLDPYLSNEFLNRFPEDIINSAKSITKRKNIYALKWGDTSIRLIYNKDLFKRAHIDENTPPKTLDNLVQYSNAIAQSALGEGIYGFALPAGSEWSGFALSMEIPGTYSNVYRYDFKNNSYDLNVYKPWLEAFIKMKEEKSLFPGELSLQYDHALAQFSLGNIGMMFAPSWALIALRDSYYSSGSIGVAYPPLFSDSTNQGTLETVPDYFGINSQTNYREAAFEFWKFLYSDDYYIACYNQGITSPVIPSIKESTSISNQYNQRFLIPDDKTEANYPIPLLNIYEQSRFKTYGQILQGTISVTEGLQQESKKLNDFMEMKQLK